MVNSDTVHQVIKAEIECRKALGMTQKNWLPEWAQLKRTFLGLKVGNITPR